MKLPLILAFNKTDVTPCDFAHKWMSDLDAFTEALQQEKSYVGRALPLGSPARLTCGLTCGLTRATGTWARSRSRWP